MTGMFLRLAAGVVALVGCAQVDEGRQPVYVPIYIPPIQFNPMQINRAPASQPQQQAPIRPAILVRQRPGKAITGEDIYVCTYAYLGREFERGHAGYCPANVNVN